jgi:cytochrome c oxidase subunit 2
MPARVRRKPLLCLLVAALVVLAAAGAAAAGNGGLAPVTPNSPNAHRIATTYYVILGFTGFIFVLVEGLLVYFAVKYRSRGRGREVEGAQVHGHTRLEVMWTAGPVVILAVIAAFVFYQLPHIANAPAAANPVRVTVEGHQFYWQFDYPNGAISIGNLHVPVGEVVDLRVISGDVIHSWWIPALGGKIQAIPGRTNHTWFQAKGMGSFLGPCAELCGIYHASMQGTVVVETADAYHTYITKTAPATLGKQVFHGVCATCHGMEGQGGYGPAINTNPTIISEKGVSTIVHNGFITMPAVGDTWSEKEVEALVAYMRHHVYKGATTSGG